MAQAAAFDAVLAQSRDVFRDRMSVAIGHMLDRADEVLGALAEAATDKDVQKRFLTARDLAVSDRAVIEGQFKQRYDTEVQKLTNKAKKVAQSVSFSLDELSLVEEEDLEQTLRYNDLAARISRHCESELSALDQRARVLLGDAALESEDNPFGPHPICEAYKHACQKVDCPVEIRALFMRLIDDAALDEIRAGYQEVNELLIAKSILPKIRYGISKSESKAPPAPAAPAPAPAPAASPAEKDSAASADVFSRLAQMLAPGGAAAGGTGGPSAPGMGVGGVPLVQGPELMGSLTQLQMGNLGALGEAAADLGPILAEAGNLKNILHQLKATKVGASMSQVDTVTLDIVAMLFDQLFDDRKIPIALKGLIGHLQLPMLKVAIADKELFSSTTHPARQLLDALGQIGLRLPADFGSSHQLFPRLEAFIRELVDNFQEKMEIFDKVRAELEEIITEVDARVANEMEPAEKVLQRGESLAVAKVAAEEEIRKRLAGATLPRPIVRFLALQWIKYLVTVGAREGKDSDAWRDAVKTMDDLLQSIVPKATPEERRAVARVVPALLRRLKAGVAESGIEDAVSSAFFAELMRCHTEVMHAVAPKPAAEPTGTAKEIAANAKVAVREAAARDATSSGTRDPRASTPKDPRVSASKDPRASTPKDPRLAAKPAAESADEVLDFTAPVEVNNPFGQGKVSVSSQDLDFTPEPAAATASEEPVAAPAPAPAQRTKPRETIRLPAEMVVGAWVEIASDDGAERHPARLHYVSPLKSHFLFVDRKGNKVFESSRSMLARRIRMGEIGLLDREPDASLFQRMMDGITGKLRERTTTAQ